jgi:hypothetical protein
MKKPDRSLDFSHKNERTHTIEEPHSGLVPFPLLDWLARILGRRQAAAVPVEETEEEEKTTTEE